jgi:hypothetical protein
MSRIAGFLMNKTRCNKQHRMPINTPKLKPRQVLWSPNNLFPPMLTPKSSGVCHRLSQGILFANTGAALASPAGKKNHRLSSKLFNVFVL